MNTPHVVFIGAGFGGLHPARRLAKAWMEITLIDRQNYHCYQPLLYQVYMGLSLSRESGKADFKGVKW